MFDSGLDNEKNAFIVFVTYYEYILDTRYINGDVLL